MVSYVGYISLVRHAGDRVKRKDSVAPSTADGSAPEPIAIDDGFFRRLHDGSEYGVELIVIQHRNVAGPLATAAPGLAGGKNE